MLGIACKCAEEFAVSINGEGFQNQLTLPDFSASLIQAANQYHMGINFASFNGFSVK